MIQGAAVLREGLNCSREAARRGVSGILVANESQRKTIPAARHRLATVSRSEVMVNCALTGPNRRVGDNARGSDLWAVHATKRV